MQKDNHPRHAPETLNHSSAFALGGSHGMRQRRALIGQSAKRRSLSGPTGGEPHLMSTRLGSLVKMRKERITLDSLLTRSRNWPLSIGLHMPVRVAFGLVQKSSPFLHVVCM